MNETRAFVPRKTGDAVRLSEQLAELLSKQPSEDEAASNQTAVKRKEQYFEYLTEDIATL